MSWASRRQFQYLSYVFTFIGIVAFIIIWPYISKEPTCTDGRQNGGESGVDCGGSCQRICTAETTEPQILWKRAFPVTGSIYNLVALVENRNKEAGIYEVSYEFRIYNDKNILIGRREGKTFIPPNQQFAVFESRFNSGQQEIKSVDFSFTSPFVWLKKKPTIQAQDIYVDNIFLGEDENSPILSARLNNDSIYNLPEFDAIAILYGSDGNAVNASKTHKEGLDSNKDTSLLFTWPNPFNNKVVKNEILILVNPFITSF